MNENFGKFLLWLAHVLTSEDKRPREPPPEVPDTEAKDVLDYLERFRDGLPHPAAERWSIPLWSAIHRLQRLGERLVGASPTITAADESTVALEFAPADPTLPPPIFEFQPRVDPEEVKKGVRAFSNEQRMRTGWSTHLCRLSPHRPKAFGQCSLHWNCSDFL